MKPLKIILLISFFGIMVLCACNRGGKRNQNIGTEKFLEVKPEEMKYIGSIDERFQSYNVEMAEVIGGKFWKPYDQMNNNPAASADTVNFETSNFSDVMFRQIPPVDMQNSRLRKLASAIGPSYMRVSGTWANTVFFQDHDSKGSAKPPKGFNGVLTRDQWKGVIDFSKAVDAKLITSFAISEGVRDAKGIWTPSEAQKIADYTKSIEGNIVAAELFNEPNVATAGGAPAGYDAQTFAKDIAAFRKFAETSLPDMLIVGPGSGGEGVQLVPKSMPFLHSEDLLSTEPMPQFDVFSYHYYGALSKRCASLGKDLTISPEDALSEKWLSKTDTALSFYKELRDKYAPNKPIWVTETADAACGGNPWAVTFLDCFRYLDQMGRLAKGGVSIIFHNTLASSEYGLLNQNTYLPRPHYWAALLWAKLMGNEVYEAGKKTTGVDLFAHSMKGHPAGITLLIINTSNIGTGINIPTKAQQYTLTSNDLYGNTIQLNGADLQLKANDQLPSIDGQFVKAGDISLPPLSITFLTFEEAGNKYINK